jgi:hemerythrin
MAFVSWIDRLSVGNLLIDNQHKQLISYLNQLHDAMARGREKAVIDDLLGKLLAYTKEHFEREELLWASRKYAALEEHKRQHQEFLIKVLDFNRQLRSGKAINSLEVLVFLRDWFIEHVVKSDLAAAKATQIGATKRQSPMS